VESHASASQQLVSEPLLKIPFLGLPGRERFCCQPDEYGSLVGQFMALRVQGFDHPQQRHLFFNRAALIALDGLTMLSTLGSAILGDVELSGDAKLVIPHGAYRHHYSVDGHDFRFSDSCLFLPEAVGRVTLRSTVCAATVISFGSATLLPVARAMAGSRLEESSFAAVLARPALLDRRRDSRRDRLHQQLIEALVFVDRSLRIGAELNPMLRLDDLIRRLIVLLLVPDLLDAPPAPELEEEPFVHAELVDWLLAHLDQPISLSEIEQRSRYSRRSLQYAFRERFGCGPMQWLRQQRLARAHAMLELRQARSIAAVAQACGYLSQGSFSRDYRLRYGVPPSRTWHRYSLDPS
jgi:AraC-like DNA-binding protein